MGEIDKKGATIQSVDRALNLFEILMASEQPVGITDLSRETGLNKSTVYRLLNTLVQHRLIAQDPETQKYTGGLKILELSNLLLSRLHVRSMATPYLRQLVDSYPVVAHLGIINEGEIVYIDKVENPGMITIYSQVGRRAPLHCTAMGKAMLAFLPGDQALSILEKAGLPRKTPNTICSLAQFKVHLEMVRQRGYAIDNEEHELGVRCVAAPIFNYEGTPVAAVSITGETRKMAALIENGIAEAVHSTAGKISQKIGYTGSC
jgi:DNA-binding IclR family transcriptional regulator